MLGAESLSDWFLQKGWGTSVGYQPLTQEGEPWERTPAHITIQSRVSCKTVGHLLQSYDGRQIIES